MNTSDLLTKFKTKFQTALIAIVAIPTVFISRLFRLKYWPWCCKPLFQKQQRTGMVQFGTSASFCTTCWRKWFDFFFFSSVLQRWWATSALSDWGMSLLILRDILSELWASWQKCVKPTFCKVFFFWFCCCELVGSEGFLWVKYKVWVLLLYLHLNSMKPE